MDFFFTAHDITRANAWKAIAHLREEQLYTIPAGFKNNIAWNLAHMIATQQILCYKNGGASFVVPEEFVHRNKKDTSPANWNNTLEKMDEIKALFELTSKRFAEDYRNGIFSNYAEYTTSAGITLRTIEDAIAYNYGHENLHYGTILSLRKLV